MPVGERTGWWRGWPRGGRRRRLAGRLAAFAAVVVVAAAFMLWRWWVSPEHRLSQFIAAATSGDCGQMIRLADPAEVSKLGLTAPRLRTMLREATGTHEGRALLREAHYVSLSVGQRMFNRLIEARLAPAGAGAAATDASYSAPMYLCAYTTNAGWKIGLSDFVFNIVVARHEHSRRARYSALCAVAGVPAQYLYPVTCEWRSTGAGGAGGRGPADPTETDRVPAR